MYMAQTTVAVQPQCALDYIEDYLLSTSEKEEDAIGNLIMDFDATEDAVDIKPLLELSERSKNISVKVNKPNFFLTGDKASLKDFMKGLFRVRNWSVFHQYLEKAVTALEVRYDEDVIKTAIYNKAKYWENWFDDYSTGMIKYNGVAFEQYHSWALKSGMDVKPCCTVDIETQFCYVP